MAQGDGMELAPAYALALDLEAQGLDEATLAEAIGVPVQAVAALLAMARAKAADAARPELEVEAP